MIVSFKSLTLLQPLLFSVQQLISKSLQILVSWQVKNIANFTGTTSHHFHIFMVHLLLIHICYPVFSLYPLTKNNLTFKCYFFSLSCFLHHIGLKFSVFFVYKSFTPKPYILRIFKKRKKIQPSIFVVIEHILRNCFLSFIIPAKFPTGHLVHEFFELLASINRPDFKGNSGDLFNKPVIFQICILDVSLLLQKSCFR